MSGPVKLSDLTLSGGTVSGELSLSGADVADIRVIVDGNEIARVTVAPSPGESAPFEWRVPVAVLQSGWTSIRFVHGDGGAEIGRMDIVAGANLDGNLAAQVIALRAEFDLLKRAFITDAADPRLRAADRPVIVAEAVAAVERLSLLTKDESEDAAP